VLNEHTCIVSFIWRTAQFYANESCGKCTPCREGTKWMLQILDRIVRGQGQEGDVELLVDITKQIDGRSFCGLGDAAAWPVAAAVRVFPEEFEHFVRTGRSLVQTPEARAMAPSWQQPAFASA
jgi:NADH-quinone oxidoreductase subunit F